MGDAVTATDQLQSLGWHLASLCLSHHQQMKVNRNPLRGMLQGHCQRLLTCSQLSRPEINTEAILFAISLGQ